jgi:transcription-repair coupling factor (superfamily II helicase)
MRDLEIRGAGNLLGAEQHGHMDAVGYDMYCKLLAEAVMEQKGETPPETFETTIDVLIDAYIPGYFIEDEEQKLEIYKKIALITDERDYSQVQEEIEDRFGDLPRPVNNLLDIALFKAEANKKGIMSITKKQRGVVLVFRADAPVEPGALAKLVAGNKGKLFFTAAANPYLTYRLDDENGIEKELGEIRKVVGGIVMMQA